MDTFEQIPLLGSTRCCLVYLQRLLVQCMGALAEVRADEKAS